MILREYQQTLYTAIQNAWAVVRHVLAVLPTGGGKTVVFGNVIANHNGASCVIAHRQELVVQISLALAKYGVVHRIIGQKHVVRLAVAEHIEATGKSFYDPNARCAVAGVDTLIRSAEKYKQWAEQVSLCVIDEGHHLLKDNKWGKAVAVFPRAKVLAVTATPKRADGKGLGSHADGVIDIIVEGPSMRDLIKQGFLTNYRIFAPPSDLDLEGVRISKVTGEYNREQLKTRIQRSTIIGDVVAHYLRLARGKLGVTFVPDVETATETAQRFNDAGVPAAVVSAKTPHKERAAILKRFGRRELLQLVNVDLFGEGFDLPAIEVISMARPTKSFALFCQQFGRALRIMDGKEWAIIIDHVGNTQRHARAEEDPETGETFISLAREWSLDRRESRRAAKDEGLIPVKTCQQCTGVYEAFYNACPFCGYVIIPAMRSAPEFVDGDLTELDPAAMAAIQGEIARIDSHPDAVRSRVERSGAGPMAARGAASQHRKRQEAQAELRESIAWWAGHERAGGRVDHDSYRKFYFMFGVDVLTAQTLGRPGAEELTIKINNSIGRVI